MATHQNRPSRSINRMLADLGAAVMRGTAVGGVAGVPIGVGFVLILFSEGDWGQFFLSTPKPYVPVFYQLGVLLVTTIFVSSFTAIFGMIFGAIAVPIAHEIVRGSYKCSLRTQGIGAGFGGFLGMMLGLCVRHGNVGAIYPAVRFHEDGLGVPDPWIVFGAFVGLLVTLAACRTFGRTPARL